ncbi:MAG: nucleotide disphospho-sugar-binding domain-containing protein, partial [Planctomycetota bacterium]
ACERGGHRGLFLTKFAEDIPALPDSIAHFDYVAMKHVIHRCKAIVHSGCIGTLSHALNAGVPQIVRPVVNDQLDNAARVERLGVGSVLSPSQFTVSRLVNTIREFAESQKVIRRCEVVSSWTGSDPVANICDEMEYLFYRASQPAAAGPPFSSSAAMESLRIESHDLDSA